MAHEGSFPTRQGSFFEEGPQPYQILDDAGLIRAVNAAWEDVLGWPRREVVGGKFSEVVSAADRERIEAQVTNLGEGEIKNLRGSLTKKSGDQVLIELQGRCVVDPDQEALVTLWSLRDISDQVPPGFFLEDDGIFQRLLHHLPAAVSVKDAQENIRYVNQKFAGMIQRAPEEVIGLNSAEITPPGLLEQYHRENQRVLDGETLWEESVFPGPEGPSYWITEKFPLPGPDGSTLVGSISSEITERVLAKQRLKRVQGQLQKSEEKFRLLAEHAQDMIVLFDPNYRIQYLNPAAERILGYSQGDFEDRAIFDVIHPEDVGELRRKIQQNITQKKTSDMKSFRILNAQGESIWCEAASSYGYQEGELRSVLVNARDITRRRQLEESLRESEERLRKSFQSDLFGLAITRKADGVYLEVNSGFLKIIGYSQEEVLGSSTLELGFVTEDSRRRLIQELEQHGQLRNRELTIPRKDGELRTVLTSVSELEVRGEACVLTSVIDITDRVRMQREIQSQELKYRALYENAPLPYQSLDEEGRILDVNPAWLRALGYQREEVVGSHFSAFLHPDWREAFGKNFKRFKELGFVRDVQFRMLGSEGQELEVAFEGCVGTTPEGEFKQTYCVFQDITEQKRAEEALLNSRERFKSLYQKTPVMLHSINREGDLVEVSDHWLEVMGYQRSEVIGRRSTEFLTEDSRRYARQVTLPMFFEKGEAWDVHYQFVTKGGEVLEILMSAVAEYDQGGEYLRSLAVMEDVTGRLAVQRQLKQSEQKYRRLVDRSPDIFYIYSLERGALFWSDRVEEILGYAPGDLVERPFLWHRAIHPEDRHWIQQQVAHLQPGDSFTMEYRVRDRKGHWHWLLDRSISVREDQGEILIEGLASDITSQKQMEMIQDLRLKLVEGSAGKSVEQLLRLALDQAEEVTESWIGFFHFLASDEKTIRLQAWSTHTEAVLCTADGHGLHYPVEEAGVWADAIRQRRPVIHNDYAALEGKRGMPEGHAPVFRELVVPVFRQGKIVAVFGLGNKPTPYSQDDLELVSQIAEYTWDIVGQKRAQAELKKSERRYRGIVEDQIELICRFSREGELTFVNQAYARFFGKPVEELTGSNLFQLMPESDREWVHQQFQDLSPDNPETRYRHRNIAADGSLRWVEWTDRAIFDDQGDLVEYQAIGYDVHDQVQLERALKKREEDYQELVGYLQKTREEERSLIASEIHDSLGQSLTVMKFDLDWVLNHLPEDHDRVTDRIHSTLETVDQTMSQVRKIGTSLRPDLLDNLGLGAALEWQMENFGERSGIHCDLDISGQAERLDPHLEVDVFRLAQEALTNVARHAEAENVQLRLIMEEDEVCLEISDDGVGITAQRASGPEAFGLISMRERTRRWGGEFSIQGDEEGGTTLRACFSRTREAEGD